MLFNIYKLSYLVLVIYQSKISFFQNDLLKTKILLHFLYHHIDSVFNLYSKNSIQVDFKIQPVKISSVEQSSLSIKYR